MPYYLIDDNKNKVEVTSIDQFYTTVATQFHSDLNNTNHHIEFVTQAQYNRLSDDGDLVANTYYFITDDSTSEDLDAHISQNDSRVSSLESRTDALEDERDHYLGGNFDTLEELLDECWDWWHDQGEETPRCYGKADDEGYYFERIGSDADYVFYGYENGRAIRNSLTSSWDVRKLAFKDELAPASIDPTAQITQTGIYVVVHESGTPDRFTSTICINDLTMMATGTSVVNIGASDNVVTLKAVYVPSSGLIKYHNSNTGNHLTPDFIYLVAKI